MAIRLYGAVAKDRRRFLKYLVLATAVIELPGLISCAPVRPMVLAIHPWVGYETLYLANEFKWLPEAVVFHEGSSLSDSFAALLSGQADAACMTLDEMLRARGSGIPMSVALVFDVSAGADMVLARPGITEPADLAGKRLGLEQNVLGILMLQKLLQVGGIDETSLTLVELPPDRQNALYRISVHEDLSVDEVQQVLAGVTMPTLAANRRYLIGQESLLIDAARTLSATMVRYGLLAQEDDLEGLIMPDTLPGDQ